jgi:isoquinoline 1-oxidoreductase beta subunit
MTSVIKPINRREFLRSSGGVALFVGVSGILPHFISCTNTKEIQRQLEKHQLTSWVYLANNGEITIYNPAAEMGQGSMTSLPVLFAEEMDADWSKVHVEFSPQEAAVYGSIAWDPNTKVMITAGSRVTRGYYMVMRKAGAQARYILMHSAAKHWNVPLEDLHTEPGEVIYAKENKRLTYGDLVPYLEIPGELPDFTVEELKDPKNYRLIG